MNERRLSDLHSHEVFYVQLYKTIPIYGTITVTEKATRTEPLYGDVCYQSTKTRTVTDPGTTKTKWSTYNDKSLLDAGWTYTGRTKLK